MYLKNIFVLYYVTFIIVVSSIVPGKIRDKYNRMKNKMADLLNVDKSVQLLLDINELEFPRANRSLINMHNEMWHEYYDCLKKQYIEAGADKTLRPLAITAMEGTSATMPCTICISPMEIHTIELIEWFYNSSSDGHSVNVLLDTTEHIVLSADDRTLTLFNVQKNQEGLYWCKMNYTLSAPYYLYVANDTEPILMVRPDEAPNAEHSIPPIIINKYGLKIYSSWSSWSPCSSCNTVGKRIRYGYCTISMVNIPKTTTKRSKLLQWKLTYLTLNILLIFQNKLPCRSWYTPKDIQEIPEVKNRSTEMMTSFCKIKCQNNVIFEIRDAEGTVLESANNSAGIYSMIQGIPDPQPSIARVTRYGLHNTYAEIKCPGNLNTDMPLVWQIGTKIINPQIINQQSHGRISVDSYQRIIFKNLRYADANIYSCWQRQELAGTIRLKVMYELTSDINALDHRVLMFASIPLLSTFLWVFWRAFRGRNRYTKH